VNKEEEYFQEDNEKIFPNKEKIREFVNDSFESTEMYSLFQFSTNERSETESPFLFSKKNETEELNEGMEEILGILKPKLQSSKNVNYNRRFSKSDPQFYAKKINLKGKVICSEKERNSSNFENVKKPVPIRPENPFGKKC